jgi:hypothetical protein
MPACMRGVNLRGVMVAASVPEEAEDLPAEMPRLKLWGLAVLSTCVFFVDVVVTNDAGLS